MVEMQDARWLLLDGYEDEPAAFGVPPYIGFHVRYVAGVFEEHKIEYDYITIDEWRVSNKHLDDYLGIVILAGAVVPGKYLRGTPISRKEIDTIIFQSSNKTPILCGGWAIRGWKYNGWHPLRRNLFLGVQDLDATLDYFLRNQEFRNKKRDSEQWEKWALLGAKSKAVTEHPDLKGPLTYEVEVYQGCVRYKNGCKFCIEPKKGVPKNRTPEDVISEIKVALDSGVKNVRLGGMTDVYTYLAEGVTELEFPIPNPEPIAKLLHGIREDERLEILHVDNANPSIIAESMEPSEEITKTLVETLSDGSVLSFGLESADPIVHTENWLNCDLEQAKKAIRLINKYGKKRGDRGLPMLIPGLNFIAGLNGETPIKTYNLNKEFLQSLVDEGLWLRRINIRQVEGKGFQDIPEKEFKSFKTWTRENVDAPLLKEIFPIGQELKDVRWESHDSRIRLPKHLEQVHLSKEILGKGGVTFGRQIGAYPILIGVPYLIPLESTSNILITGHGMRSITGVECNLDINNVTEKQLEAIPGISKKGAWSIISERVKRKNKGFDLAFENAEDAFDSTGLNMTEIAHRILI